VARGMAGAFTLVWFAFDRVRTVLLALSLIVLTKTTLILLASAVR
jgi:hypothetical protein